MVVIKKDWEMFKQLGYKPHMVNIFFETKDGRQDDGFLISVTKATNRNVFNISFVSDPEEEIVMYFSIKRLFKMFYKMEVDYHLKSIQKKILSKNLPVTLFFKYGEGALLREILTEKYYYLENLERA